MAETKAWMLCAGLFLSAWMPAGCNHAAIDMNAATSPAAYEWLRRSPNPFDGKPLDQWKLVPNTKQPVAESMLQTVSWVRLTEPQANELVGVSSPSSTSKTAPYLLRAVGSPARTNEFIVETQSNGDVWVESGARSHHALPIERRAVVVWLDHPPHEVYISFSVAE
jgi:hypothetical protein